MRVEQSVRQGDGREKFEIYENKPKKVALYKQTRRHICN